MDSKRFYKKISTLIWWVLAVLPLIIALIQFAGYHLTFNSGIASASDLSDYHNMTNGQFYTILESVLTHFDFLTISFFKTSFSDLFNYLGIQSYSYLSILISYMLSVSIYHLIFDLFNWLPNFFHRILEKSKIGD
jgi:hypothetical protein